MKIGILQFSPQNKTVQDNVDFIISKTIDTNSSLIVLPEFSFSSYINFDPFTKSSLLVSIEPLIKHSKKNNLSFIGSIPLIEKDQIYNRSIYVTEGQIVSNYDKRNLFGSEKEVFSSGQKIFQMFSFSGLKFSIQICFDNVDPIATRLITLEKKIDLLLAPASVSVGFIRDILKVRCLENQIITVFCNRVGTDNGVYFSGKSAIFLPDGRELSVNSEDEVLLLHSIEESVLKENEVRREAFFQNSQAYKWKNMLFDL